jgi:dTDP-4-dehydrorhamnose reductase
VARLLIIGGSSYLGQTLVPLARLSHAVSYTYFRRDPLKLPGALRLDVRERPEVEKAAMEVAPDAIIHLAGSNRTADMETVIVEGTANVARAAGLVKARLLFLSSDVIFNGRNAPYDELSRPSPLHAYGQAKATAELSAAGHPNHVIIRTSLIYDLARMDHFTAWIVDSLTRDRPITLFEDQIRNPVWSRSLSEACLELAAGHYRGILNVAGALALSRSAYALKLLSWWGYESPEGIDLGPAPVGHPRDCRLDLRRARRVLRTNLPGVDEVLQGARAGRP